MVANIINGLKKYKSLKHIKSVSSHIVIGKSHFYNSFRLLINKPLANKIYLKVGENTIVDAVISYSDGSGEVLIGNNSWVGNSSLVCNTKIEIGDNVFISWGGYICDHDSHSIDYRERQNDIVQQLNDYHAGLDFLANKNWAVVNTKAIKIKDNVWVGMNCIILKGVTIGEGAVLAAGSVVAKDVPAWTVVAGNPARVVKEIPEELRRK